MIKILSIVGARPQFIKAAVLSRLIRSRYRTDFVEYLVHTGQHYDANMSEIFFQEMMIPKPDRNLNVGSGTHGKQTGEMLIRIEEVILEQKPDIVLVYGDTNSTLAGALAASKLHIPVAHVEAGLRSFNMEMPEEQNRVLTDHISTFLFCPTEVAKKNLIKEGIDKGVEIVGDIMFDASLFYREFVKTKSFEVGKKLEDNFYLLTLHRAENTDDYTRLHSIVDALNSLVEYKGVFPIHPRTKKALERFGLGFGSHIKVIEPVGFLEMLWLEEKASFIVTDSGGVQKEAYFFNKPCITLRDQTEWVETVKSGWNVLVGASGEKIKRAFKEVAELQSSRSKEIIVVSKPKNHPAFYGNGDAGIRILEYIKDKLLSN